MAVADPPRVADPQPSPPPRPANPTSAPHLPYFPALDGIRGLAVAGVLLFHAGFGWMVGGYLGVSTFFTLSGFLITSLLLAERAASGKVSLKAFWVRRFRRLMPASLACLVLALLFGVFVADAIQRGNLAGDVIASLAYVANWRFIFSGQSYADLFAAGESPVLHFWSLAIEEQFYLVYPLMIALLVGVGSLARRSLSDRNKFWFRAVGSHYRKVVGGVLVLLIAGSLALTLFAGFSQNRIYLGTDTRASELLVGALLAVLLFNAKVTGHLARRGAVQVIAIALGVGALIASIVMWSKVPQDASWLYRGGFTFYALISAVLITSAILPAGPVAWLLAARPLRHLGRISYGVYLFHWPVFLALRQKAHIDHWPLLLIGGAITLVVAELSFHFLEMPVRRGRPLFNRRPIRVAPFAVVGIAIVAIVLTTTAPPTMLDFASTQDQLAALAAEAGDAPSTTVDPSSLVPPAQPRMATFGDSTALQTSWGLANFMRNSGQGTYVDGFTGVGCSVIRTDQRRMADGTVIDNDKNCNDWENIWTQKVDANKPDIAVVQVGPWEIVDRKLPGEDKWRGPGDPEFDDFLFSEMTTAVDTLSAKGAIVVWLTAAPPGTKANQPASNGYDPAQRMARFDELVRKLPDARPGKVVVVDLADWISRLSPQDDAHFRFDGVHFATPGSGGYDSSTEAAEQFLGPAILDAWKKQWVANRRDELEAGPPVPLLVLGDESASDIADGLAAWSDAGHRFNVTNGAVDGCGFGVGGSRLNGNDRERVPDVCDEPMRRYFDALFRSSAQTAVLSTGLWDVTDRQLPGDPTWRAPGDPLYDAWLRDQLAQATDYLHQNGVQNVVWLLSPHVDLGREPGKPSQEWKSSEPTRIDRLNDLIEDVASSRDFVKVIDLAAFTRDWPNGEFDDDYRPNGVSPNPDGAASIADWLGPQLLELAQQPPPEQAEAAPAGAP